MIINPERKLSQRVESEKSKDDEEKKKEEERELIKKALWLLEKSGGASGNKEKDFERVRKILEEGGHSALDEGYLLELIKKEEEEKNKEEKEKES